MSAPAVRAIATFLALSACAALGQKAQTAAGEAPGPWLLGTVGVGKNADGSIKTTALKGFAIRINNYAAVCYDLDLCRIAGAWTSGSFVTPMNLMSRGEFPTTLGEVPFTTAEVAGFQQLEGSASALPKSSSAEESRKRGSASLQWKDPRPEPFGPLPPGHARFKGFYVNGDNTVLKWDVGGAEVLEAVTKVDGERGAVFVERVFEFGASEHTISIPVIGADGFVEEFRNASELGGRLKGTGNETGAKFELLWLPEISPTFDPAPSGELKKMLADLAKRDPARAKQVRAEIEDAEKRMTSSIEKRNGMYWVSMPAGRTEMIFRMSLSIGDQDRNRSTTPYADLKRSAKSGPARWPEPVVTRGEVSAKQDAAYVVDTIALPDPNPWNAPMFIGGFDFFPDGRAAVCTFHGDVFVVSGIDEKLEQVTWRRFATGLYHGLGLKIVNGEIYVTCRDGLWRLRDLNNDGECDFYEAFNFDSKVTKSFHEFTFDLQTDPAGNFYFAKAGPVKNGGRGFDEIMSQHGTLMRVSPDGAKLDVIATGFRAPNGIGVGPHGELTSGDNEGTWTPACKINWIKPGGFYGVVDLAHRTPAPTDYDRPLCWLPKRVDNSGGGQVWVPDDDRWGPWRGQLLHTSYGQSALFSVMREEVGGTMQGGVAKFPLTFQSGIMRARFNPKDGQLYVAGLRGWQTNGVKNGCLQRVRYTGAPVRMPVALHVKKGGIELQFASSLDTQSAADVENWNVEVWNYVWSASYGSPEVSTLGTDEKPTEAGKDGAAQWTPAQLKAQHHDPLTVKSVRIGTDDRTVFLEIPGLKPVMQMAIKYHLKSADGVDISGEVVNTIHALGE